MSSGYATRLSEYKNKGICGLPENYDTKRSLSAKVKQLAELIENASNVIVLTGAGISTSAGIPDFRGPNGIWTKEQREKKGQCPGNNGIIHHSNNKRKRDTNIERSPTPQILEDFSHAKPTLCHRAITKLVNLGKVQYCITQNVDGLHKRSGLCRNKHAFVHGCVFTEKCESCHSEFYRDFDVGGMSFQLTKRQCTICGGGLRDTLLDWNDPLPDDDLDYIYDECHKPGTFLLCLGTSLRIKPIGDLPLEVTKFCIVNLQQTPVDEQATLIIRGSVDKVMNELMIQLGYPNWQNEPDPPIERIWKPQSLTTKADKLADQETLT